MASGIRVSSCLVVFALALLAAAVPVGAADTPALPPFPGLEETPPPPLPGSAEVGKNPLNAAHVDTGMTVEALLARGLGVGFGFERSLGSILGFEADLGYLGSGGGEPGASWRLNLLSLMGGVRLSVMQTAVNGPSVGLAAGEALSWFRWGGRLMFFAWPQVRLDLAMKLSFGPSARGLFIEPRVGYKVVFMGAETENLPLPRYGGFTFGLRGGISF
jgi:hypothetical protein